MAKRTIIQRHCSDGTLPVAAAADGGGSGGGSGRPPPLPPSGLADERVLLQSALDSESDDEALQKLEELQQRFPGTPLPCPALPLPLHAS